MIQRQQAAESVRSAARRAAWLVVGCLVLAQGASASAAELCQDGSIAVTIDGGLTVRDYVELQSGNNWGDALASADHSPDRTGNALSVQSQVNSGQLSRTVYETPGETIYIWRLNSTVAGYRRWRLGVRLPAARVAGADCQAWLFYSRADQVQRFPLNSPEDIPSPLNRRGGANINMEAKAIEMSLPSGCLRVDMDRDAGSRQFNWVGDDLLFEIDRLLAPNASLGAVVRLATSEKRESGAEFERPLQAADLLEHSVSVTPYMNKRGLYYEGEPVGLRLHALAPVAVEYPVPVQYRLLDYFGEEVVKGTVPVLSAASRDEVKDIALAPGRQGLFRLELAIGAEQPFTKELTFGVVPRPKRIGPDSGSVFGTHAILSNPHFPKLAAQMGIRWTRMWGGNISNAALWRTVEPEPGKFEWHDEQVQMARNQNLNLLGLLGSPLPKFIEQDPTAWDDDDLKAWSRYVSATVSHYKQHIKYWEIWNEPYFIFKMDGEPYVRVLRAAYEAAKEADPDCVVVGTCGPPWSTDWFESVFKAGGLQYQDIVSAHLYPPGGGHNPLDYDETLRSFVGQIRKLMVEHGGLKELWDTEAGMTPATNFNRSLRPRYFRGYGTPVPVEAMTDMSARLYVAHLAEGVRFFYYLLHGSFEYDSALCENNGDPLPAAASIAVAASLIDGGEFVGAASNGPARAYAFCRGDEGVIALWGIGLAGRKTEMRLGFSPRKLLNVMGNPIPTRTAAGNVAAPITPSPVYLLVGADELDASLAAIEKAPPPELEVLAVNPAAAWDELLGRTLTVDVQNFEPGPMDFDLRVESLPAGWQLKPRGDYGRQGAFVVHGNRKLVFPLSLAEGAVPAGDATVAVRVGERETRYKSRVELPVEAPPAPQTPRQPPAELIHRGIEYVSVPPWTLKVQSNGLAEIYHGADPLLKDFYFYVARRGINMGIVTLADAKRAVERTEAGARITLTRESAPYGKARLTIDARKDEVLLSWSLSVAPTDKGWGELGFYIPEQRLNDGYPCDSLVTSESGKPRTLALSAESHPFRQATGVKGLEFRTSRGDWGMEIGGASFTGSHGVYFQDFRNAKGHRDHYRTVLSYSATQGFDANFSVRLWSKLSTR
ncbi:MAG: endo-1,4-beta-xylanase [Planctomycetes bacterium]|nr:endo-1,4-beta-xylanase [Planctomycetota bacterium]